MATDHRAFRVAKHGNTPEEWEDAYAADVAAGRFAVADGAAESVFAASWAQALVNRFVSSVDCGPEQWSVWLPPVQKEWLAGFQGRQLPWYAESKLKQGAFATFLGVVLAASQEAPYDWHGVAVGDSCLFHVRDASLLDAFPMTKSEDFGTAPQLLGSRTSPEEVRAHRAVQARGVAYPDDRLWMMTDALSQWFWKEQEAGNKPWADLEWLLSPSVTDEEFALFIDDLRAAKRLRNDDVTLLIVTL